MSTSKLKQNIRFAKAQQKLLKKIYPSGPVERKLVQLNEKFENLSKWSNLVWKSMSSAGFRPGIDNSNKDFFKFFEELNTIEELKNKCAKSIEVQERKGITTEQAMQTMYLLNAGRASQSF